MLENSPDRRVITGMTIMPKVGSTIDSSTLKVPRALGISHHHWWLNHYVISDNEVFNSKTCTHTVA